MFSWPFDLVLRDPKADAIRICSEDLTAMQRDCMAASARNSYFRDVADCTGVLIANTVDISTIRLDVS